MRSRQFIAMGLAALTLGLGGSAISACVGDDPVIPAAPSADASTDTAVTPPSVLATNGQGCTAATQCQSGQCVDGVCCESACSGTCERCNLPGSLGKCEAVPDGLDPDKECPTVPLPDVDTGATDAGAADGGEGDAGPAFLPPDGGLPPTNENMCAGHCNGKRACAYAGADVTCGTSFCGNKLEEGKARCDGAGHCLYGAALCSAYVCPEGGAGCKTSCTGNADCLATHFCDGATQTCRPKIDNGVNCATPDQCKSGVCDTTGGAGGVCCNIDCTTTPGGTCRQAGSVGICQCSACPSGPCALFYRDEDDDTFGDQNGTVGNGRAQYACADESNRPAGFVANNRDCLDSTAAIAKSVRPNQTGWFTSSYTNAAGVQSYDYNCSGTTEKQHREGACGFCRSLVSGVGLEAPPPVEEGTDPEGLSCVVQFFNSTCSSTTSAPGRFCKCGAQNPPGFTNPVACGTTASATTCTSCAVAGGNAGTTFAGSLTQGCH